MGLPRRFSSFPALGGCVVDDPYYAYSAGYYGGRYYSSYGDLYYYPYRPYYGRSYVYHDDRPRWDMQHNKWAASRWDSRWDV